MFGWGRLSRPSPPLQSPQPVTTAGGATFPPLTGQRPPGVAWLGRQIPSAVQTMTAPFVSRVPNRGDIVYAYQYGAVRMPITVPYPGGADGQVWRSRFQPDVRHLTAWAPSSSFMRMAFPTNRGGTFRVDQLKTQATGAAGPGRMQPRPFFTRVQRIPRFTRNVPTYNTQSSPA